MASLDMFGPFDLTDDEVNKRVEENRVGNYAFGCIENIDGKRVFVVRYVGRSDTNLRERIKQSYKQNESIFFDSKCNFFKFSYASTIQEAYEKECRNYHDFGEHIHLLNKEHPAKPKDKEYFNCPIDGCGK